MVAASMNGVRLLAWGYMIVAAAACVDSAPSGGMGTTAYRDTVILEPSLTLGEVEGDANYLFGSISAVAADAEGRIYVGDASEPSLRVFDPSGAFLRQLAGPGRGPGELSGAPRDIWIGEDGSLYVRDGTRVTVWVRRQPGSIADSVAETWLTPNLGNPSNRSRIDGSGRYHYPDGLWLPGEHPRFFYVGFVDGVREQDTLEVPPYPGLTAYRPALLRLGADALMLRGLNYVPFSAVPVWDVTPQGTIMSSDGASSILIETDMNGDTLRLVSLSELGTRAISEEERADSLSALESRLARWERFPLDQAEGLGEGVLERRLPEEPPAVIRIRSAENGTIWAERWPPAGGSGNRYYDVVPVDSAPYVVVLRAPIAREPAPWVDDRSVIGVVRDPESGIERVVRFSLPQGR